MENDSENALLLKCLNQIETNLGWGTGDKWSTQEFKALSEKIFAVTGTNLSVATLKRLWGTISYDSKPTITTLNALVQFIGYENWRIFEQSHTATTSSPSVGTIETHTKTGMPARLILMVMAALAFASFLIYFLVFSSKGSNTKAEVASFSFSSKKMVSEGVPNSVIFDYDASAAAPEQPVFIQQSWDTALRQQVSRHEKVHTSIYYYPGFFQAKLVVGDSIVKEHPLYIKTPEWLPVAEQDPVPVYFHAREAIHDGQLSLPLHLLQQKNIPMQPRVPWVSYFNIRDFEGVSSDNFVFETEIKNDYSEGSAVCQHSEIHILLEGGALIVPLSIPGCVSEIALYDINGRLKDPSPLGVSFGDWVKVRYEVKNKVGRVLINGETAYDSLNLTFPPVKLVGIRYRFQGTGSINYVKLGNDNGGLAYEEDF